MMNMGIPTIKTGNMPTGVSGGIGEPASYTALDAVQTKLGHAIEVFKQYMAMPGESEEADAGQHKVILGHLQDALDAIAEHKKSYEGENKTATQNKSMNDNLRAYTGRGKRG